MDALAESGEYIELTEDERDRIEREALAEVRTRTQQPKGCGFPNSLVLYFPREKGIAIKRVLHASRDYRRFFG